MWYYTELYFPAGMHSMCHCWLASSCLPPAKWHYATAAKVLWESQFHLWEVFLQHNTQGSSDYWESMQEKKSDEQTFMQSPMQASMLASKIEGTLFSHPFGLGRTIFIHPFLTFFFFKYHQGWMFWLMRNSVFIVLFCVCVCINCFIFLFLKRAKEFLSSATPLDVWICW